MFNEQEFQEAKAESCFQVLMQTARLINEEGIRRIRKLTGKDIKASHMSLLPHISFEGSRLTDLAKVLGITKQAVNQLVNELESMNFLERSPDPNDGRAKLIHFSKHGQNSLFNGLQILNNLEADLLSPEETEILLPILLKLNAAIKSYPLPS